MGVDVDRRMVAAVLAGDIEAAHPFWRMLPSVIGWIGSSSLPYFQAKNRQGTKSSAPAQLVLVMKPILFRVMT